MSFMEHKFVIRGKINKEFKTRNEVYEYFRDHGILDELADYDLDDDTQNMDYLVYKETEGAFVPYQGVETHSWYIDYIVSYDSENYYFCGSLSNKELKKIKKQMKKQFDIESIAIVSYSWYFGVDEPEIFQ